MRRMVALLLSMCAGCAAAPTARDRDELGTVRALAATSRSAPWVRSSLVSSSCGDSLVVIEIEYVEHAEIAVTPRAYASTDGRTWQEEALPEGFLALSLRCVDGTLFALGRPSMLVRRSAGEWVVELAIPEDETRVRSGSVDLLEAARPGEDLGSLVAYGLDEHGVPFEYHRGASGTWERRESAPPRRFRSSAGSDPGALCRGIRSHLSRRSDSRPILRAHVCRSELLTWSAETGPPVATALPPSMQCQDWRPEVVGGRVLLLHEIQRGDFVRTRLVLYGEDGWAETSVESPIGSVVFWRGRLLLLGSGIYGIGVVYELEGGARVAPAAVED